MKLNKRLFRHFGIFLGLFWSLFLLTSCGSPKLSCDSDMTQHLAKQLFAKYELEPGIFSEVFNNPFLSTKNAVDSYIATCQQLKNRNDKDCQIALNLYKKVQEKYIKNSDDNIVLKSFFQDAKDENSKSIICHAEVYVRSMDNNKLVHFGTIKYKAQISTDNSEEEVDLLDFQVSSD